MRTIAVSLVLAALFAGTAGAADGRWGVAVFPSGAEFRLEFAETGPERALGYMYRESVGPNEGMFFVFPSAAHHTIWMKNCKVALDIVWLDEDLRVVEILHDFQPCPDEGDCPSASPMRPSRWVLELAAGVANREGLAPGDRIDVIVEPPLP